MAGDGMINLQPIEYLLKLAVVTPFIQREKPVSVMLIAPPEHGKSEVLKKFAFVDSVAIATNFDSYVFSEIALQYPNKRTIIIPDFLRITKRKYSTQSNALTILNALTEEGWIGKLPLGQSIQKPIVMNVLTALTKDELRDKRHKWATIGFLSRFVPVTYSYKEETIKQIRNYIKDRIYRVDEPYNGNFLPKNDVDVILPKEVAEMIESIVLDISEEENILGFRLQRQLQTLAMANAILNGRNIVQKEDYLVIKELSKFINFKFTEV